MARGEYNGRYFRTCQADIKASDGWFGKICLLGLIQFVPIFGQMTLYGYAFEWAHQIAWGVDEPLPKKIYGRPGSKMLRWGWFALVIAFVFGLIPGLVQGIGSFISSLGAATLITASHNIVATGGSPILVGLGGLINLIGSVAMPFFVVFACVGIIRMTMYDRLGTGLQFGKVWAMIKYDFGGLMRIFGMFLLLTFLTTLIITIVATFVLMLVLGAAVAPLLVSIGGGSVSSMTPAAASAVAAAALTALPLVMVFLYIAFVANSWIELLVARAIGYWCQQFDVADWGTKDDPLPFERTSAQQPATQYMPPVTPVAAPAAQAPAAQAPAAEEVTPTDTATVVEVEEIIGEKEDEA